MTRAFHGILEDEWYIIKPLPKHPHTGTVIFLHGLGDNGYGWSECFTAFQRKREGMPLAGIKFICPSAVTRAITRDGGYKMPAWYDIKTYDKTDPNQDESGVRHICNSVRDLIEHEHVQYGIPYEKIILGGFSQGGSISLFCSYTALDKKIGGIVALSTYLPLMHHFPNDMKEHNAYTPLFMAHGNADTVITPDIAVMSLNLINNTRQAKFFSNPDLESKTLKEIYEYDGMAHTVCSEETNDLIDFMINIFKD